MIRESVAIMNSLCTDIEWTNMITIEAFQCLALWEKILIGLGTVFFVILVMVLIVVIIKLSRFTPHMREAEPGNKYPIIEHNKNVLFLPVIELALFCFFEQHNGVPVSYTHLTLPTNREV